MIHHEKLINDSNESLATLPWELIDFQESPFGEEGQEVRILLIFDGTNRGRFMGEAIIQFAQGYGFEASKDEHGSSHTDADSEFYYESIDEAIQFLNEILQKTQMRYVQDEDFFLVETRGED